MVYFHVMSLSPGTVATSKAPWDRIDAEVKVVNYTSLQWTIDTCHRIIDSERAPKRPFFPLRTALCSLGSGMSLMMQSDSKMTHPAMCLDHHESNNFSTVYAWRIKFGHTYSYPHRYIYLNLNKIIYIYCTLRHIAGLIKQCQRHMLTNVDPLIDVQKLYRTGHLSP